MSKTSNPQRPLYRVTFSRITGKDADGNDILSRPCEIGAAWPRKNGKAGCIISFSNIPVELARREGVVFLVPVARGEEGGAQ